MTTPAPPPERPLNWADEEPGAIERPIVQPTPSGVSVEFRRETTRSRLAHALMMLLALTVLTILLLAGLQKARILHEDQISIVDLTQAVLTPVVTLTGTALGFYF